MGVAGLVCLPAFAVFEIAVFLAVTMYMLLLEVFSDIVLKLFKLVDFLALQLSLLFCDLLLSDFPNIFHLIEAFLTTTLSITKVAIFEALAIAIKAWFTVVALGFCVFILGFWSVFVEELSQQLFSHFFVFACSSAFLARFLELILSPFLGLWLLSWFVYIVAMIFILAVITKILDCDFLLDPLSFLLVFLVGLGLSLVFEGLLWVIREGLQDLVVLLLSLGSG